MPESWESINVWYRSGAIVVAGIFAHLFFKLFILRGLEKISDATTNDLDDRLVYFIKRFYVIVLSFALLLLLLKNHGIAITPFLASAGIAGIAIGLAAKETLSDILSGIFLIADRPIRIGSRPQQNSRPLTGPRQPYSAPQSCGNRLRHPAHAHHFRRELHKLTAWRA